MHFIAFCSVCKIFLKSWSVNSSWYVFRMINREIVWLVKRKGLIKIFWRLFFLFKLWLPGMFTLVCAQHFLNYTSSFYLFIMDLYFLRQARKCDTSISERIFQSIIIYCNNHMISCTIVLSGISCCNYWWLVNNKFPEADSKYIMPLSEPSDIYLDVYLDSIYMYVRYRAVICHRWKLFWCNNILKI